MNIFPSVFQSVEYVNNYLQKKYKAKKLTAYKELSYKNSYSFVYYITLGETYFTQGIQAPLSIKPVLLFYGLGHWLKACSLVEDPHYPATTQVLAHGVSTRKKKKKDYRFLSDEVKIQKDGFFPYISDQLYKVKQLTGEKYKMLHLLKSIPELASLFKNVQYEEPFLPVHKKSGQYIVSHTILKKLNFTEKQFEQMLNIKLGISATCKMEEDKLFIHVHKGSLPIHRMWSKQLFLPTDIHLYWKLPEILAHFLLLYNLSMICRYETEWWGELLYSFSTSDRTFIQMFLQTTEKKIPHFINDLLMMEEDYNTT